MKRRQFIKNLGASLVVFQSDVLANNIDVLGLTSQLRNKKIVWVMLRGAVDSLHTVVPTFEKSLSTLRPTLYKGIKNKLLPLDSGFSLHPSLRQLHALYQNKELSPVIAVSSGYGRRSHFDGQDYLESGLGTINLDSGWLSRAMAIKNKKGLAVARAVPISFRGSSNALTWYPSNLKDADDDIYESLKQLYANDTVLLDRLNEGVAVQEMAGVQQSKKRQGRFSELTKSCAKLMKDNNDIDCAMLEVGGWDTHNNQQNRLNKQFLALDNGLHVLKTELGKTWEDTIVIVATEFGRTVHENGTGGTDHGTASAMFIAGGGLKGSHGKIKFGKVVGDWPGLESSNLFENRDLKATSNSFFWIAEILASHWQFTPKELSQVFPQI